MITEAIKLRDIIESVSEQIKACDKDDGIIDALMKLSRDLDFLESLYLPDPITFWRSLSVAYKPKKAFEEFEIDLYRKWEDLHSLMITRSEALDVLASPEDYEKRIYLSLQRKNSEKLSSLKNREEFCRVGGNRILQFARTYGASTPCGNPPKEEDIPGLLTEANGILDYFRNYNTTYLADLYSSDFHPQDLFDYLYNNSRKIAEGVRGEAYDQIRQLEQDIRKEAKERASLITPHIFEIIVSALSPYFSEKLVDGRKKPGPKPTSEDILSFRDCFVTNEAFSIFMKCVEETIKIKKKQRSRETWITAPELCMIWSRKDIYGFLNPKLKSFGRFGELFHKDYPSLFRSKTCSAVASLFDEQNPFVKTVLTSKLGNWKVQTIQS